MNILTNGESIRKSLYGNPGDTTVSGAPVASVTFSGLGQDRVAMKASWLHAGTGVDRLDIQLNGATAPAGSQMVRQQFETALGVREDRLDPGFTMADLVAGAAGTFWEGVIYILTDSTLVEVSYAMVEGFAKDALLALGDRIRFPQRMGRWQDTTVGNVTSLTVVTGSGNANIGIGSHFKMFN